MDFYSEKDKKNIEILSFLKEVIDPELAINIIDLGLVYGVDYNSEGIINIKLTLSAKSCPMGDVIMNNVESCLLRHYPNFKIEVTLVWEPKWTRDFITPNGKKELGMK